MRNWKCSTLENIHQNNDGMSHNIDRFYVMNWKVKAFLSRLMREKDLTNKCTYTIACVRWVTIGGVQERFHFHNKLPKVTKVKMHLMLCFHSWKKNKDVSWRDYIGICPDGVPLMVGSMGEFISNFFLKKEYANVVSAHWFLHREVLMRWIAFCLMLQKSSFVKQKPVYLRVFLKL